MAAAPRRSPRACRARPSPAGLRSFAGVPHRLEPVAEIDGVSYVNDSKATNVAAAAAALASFDGGVHAILGGSLKGEASTALVPAVARALRRLLSDRRGGGSPGRRPRAGRRPAASDAATSSAPSRRPRRPPGAGETVLLAPACASFDAFRDYEERGQRFRELVEGLR